MKEYWYKIIFTLHTMLWTYIADGEEHTTTDMIPALCVTAIDPYHYTFYVLHHYFFAITVLCTGMIRMEILDVTNMNTNETHLITGSIVNTNSTPNKEVEEERKKLNYSMLIFLTIFRHPGVNWQKFILWNTLNR